MLNGDAYVKAFHLSPAATCVSSFEGRFIEVNESFCHLSGYRRDELIGRTAAELNLYEDPWDRNKVLALLQHDGSLKEIKSRMVSKGGVVRDCLGRLELCDAGGKPAVLTMLLAQ